MLGFRQICLTHPDEEVDLATAHRRETVAVGLQVSRDQGEQIGGLWERVLPFRPMAAIRRLADPNAVPVREQDGKGFSVSLHPHVVFGQDVGAVGKEGDAPKSLGLTLRAEHSVRGIEAHKLRVGFWVNDDFGLDRRALAANLDQERRAVEAMVRWLAIDADRNKLEIVSIEP